jgi:two-component system LytT family response regulator
VTIRVLLADDEQLARKRIRKLLSGEEDLEIVGECRDGSQVAAAILDLGPDLLFLDVQMPEMDGFAALETVPRDRLPLVIFVTAYDEHALRAFEVHALDYLLKPFDRERFEQALARARSAMRERRTREIGERVLELLGERSSRAERLVVKSGGRVSFVRIEEIDWIDAAGNYLRLHSGKETHLLRETMSSLESRLDPARFLRIHRGTIVNVDRIGSIEGRLDGDRAVVLHDGTRLALSRGYRERVRDYLDERG